MSSEGNCDWKMPLLNKNVNYAFGKCWSKSLILQYGTLNGPKRVFQQKMVLFPHKQVILVGQCQQILLRLETNSVDKLIYDL